MTWNGLKIPKFGGKSKKLAGLKTPASLAFRMYVSEWVSDWETSSPLAHAAKIPLEVENNHIQHNSTFIPLFHVGITFPMLWSNW